MAEALESVSPAIALQEVLQRGGSEPRNGGAPKQEISFPSVVIILLLLASAYMTYMANTRLGEIEDDIQILAIRQQENNRLLEAASQAMQNTSSPYCYVDINGERGYALDGSKIANACGVKT